VEREEHRGGITSNFFVHLGRRSDRREKHPRSISQDARSSAKNGVAKRVLGREDAKMGFLKGGRIGDHTFVALVRKDSEPVGRRDLAINERGGKLRSNAHVGILETGQQDIA
jgi:hypothetical protein